MTVSVISFLPLLVAFMGVQALLVVKVADHMSDDAFDSRGRRDVPGGRYFGIA